MSSQKFSGKKVVVKHKHAYLPETFCESETYVKNILFYFGKIKRLLSVFTS